MKTFVLASKNPNKAKEIEAILGSGFKVITQSEAGFGDIDVVEDGTTFEENAIKKAETIFKITKLPTIADDSGLCVDFLNGAPGIYSARYAGENATDADRVKKLLDAMKDAPDEKRSAKFVCSIALVLPDAETVTFTGECLGKITLSPFGSNGFGYDPIFMPQGFDKTLAELPFETKNHLSHRFLALSELSQYLKEL